MPFAPRRICAAVFLRFCTTLLVALLAFPLLADDPSAEPWSDAPMTADPKATLAAAEKISAGESAAVILLDEENHTFDANGRDVHAQRILYRIVTDAAIDMFGSVNAPWAPWYQERPTIQARVITKDGTVHQLDASALIESAAPEESLDIFSDNRVIRAPLPGVAVGSVVEQLITYRSKESLYDRASSDLFFFGSFIPVHRARFVVDAPAELAVKFVNQAHIEPTKTEADGRQHYVFEAGPFAPKEDAEWDLPYDVAPLPWIGVSTARNWQDLATRYNEIIEKQIAADSVEKNVREAVGNATDRREIVTRALAYIQKRVRYAGVEVGESSVVPRPPQTVLGNRYGDCKDKATLLVAMLRAAGVKAHVALLRAGESFDVPAELPGLGMFNHAIVVVDGEPRMWVDPTDEFSRAGELPTMDQGRLALIASPDTTTVVLTPTSASSANHTIETRTFTVPEEGKSNIVEMTEATGADESSMRRHYVNADRKRYRESMENYAKDYYAAKSLKKVDATDPKDLTKPFHLTLEIEEASRGIAIEGEAAVAIFPSGLLESLPWSLKQYDKNEDGTPKKPRKNDFVFARPFVKEWRYRVTAPQGFVPRTLPQNETIKLGTTTLTKEFKVENNGIVAATFRFDSGKRRLSAAEFDATRKAIDDLNESSKPVMIGFDELGMLELNAGNISGALTEFRALGAAHPKEGRHQVDIARALLAGGMGDAAREQIKKAIALEPAYARAHRMLGIILQHDVLGRPYRKGFDLPGAVAAYKKAKELDPKDDDIRGELARLLEYGEDGLMFGKGADLGGAIDEFRHLIKDLDKNRYKPELYRALANAGRVDELKEEIKTADTPIIRTVWEVIIAAMSDSSAAAIRQARSEEQAERKEVLNGAAGVLMAMRRYPEAADLLEEATKGTPSTETRAHVENIRKAKRIETLNFPANDPRSVVQRFAIISITDELTPEVVGAYFAADEKPFFEDRTEWRMSRIAMLDVARQQGLPLAFYADVGAGAMTATQDGNDETGYRVRLRSLGGNNGEDETFFVIRENGEYRISASRKVPSLIGWSVMRLLDAGKNEAARQWLNWTREELTAGGGDDPLSGNPFSAIWPRAKQAATVDEMRLAAALLMPSKETADKALPILLAAREKAQTDDVRARIDQAIAAVDGSKEEWPAALEVAQRMYALKPESATAFNMLNAALINLDRHDEVLKIANERMQRMPKDDDAMRALAGAAMNRGDYAECEKVYRQVLTELRPNAGDYNNIAWNALLKGTDLDRALEDARAAMKLPGSGSALLHTVASLYAETGKSLEAREALLQSMDDAGREEPAPHDWYVLGRIAENYGAKEAALAAYKKVEKPKTTLASSTYVLAERRMKALAKK
jgi:tetratricopeptide (TPR) repeat protein